MERFHQTLRRELLDDAVVFADLAAAQAAVDAFLHEYNTNRPHQSLDMAFPADRFRPTTDSVLPLKVPAILREPGPPPAAPPTPVPIEPAPQPVAAQEIPVRWTGGAVEFERVVPPSGNLQVAGRQFWLGPNRLSCPA